jgi:hypothetical protein
MQIYQSFYSCSMQKCLVKFAAAQNNALSNGYAIWKELLIIDTKYVNMLSLSPTLNGW